MYIGWLPILLWLFQFFRRLHRKNFLRLELFCESSRICQRFMKHFQDHPTTLPHSWVCWSTPNWSIALQTPLLWSSIAQMIIYKILIATINATVIDNWICHPSTMTIWWYDIWYRYEIIWYNMIWDNMSNAVRYDIR